MKGIDCLDQAARDVIIEGRYAIEPSLAVRERVRQRVLLRLGAGAATLLGTRTLWAGVGKWVAATLLVGTALGGMSYWRTVQRQVVVADDVLPIAVRDSDLSVREMAESSAMPSASATALEAMPKAAPAPSRATSAVASVQARANDLAAEIELLAQANAALNRSDGGRARQLLSDYDRRFGAGVLREERATAEILVLCAMGDRARARAAAARFEKRWPRSPHKVRVEASCAGTE